MQQKIVEQRNKGALSNTDEYDSSKMENSRFNMQIQGMSLEQELDIVPNQALFSWMEEEDVVFMNEVLMTSAPQV